MKKLIFLAVIITIITFVSCKKNEQDSSIASVNEIENLHNDKVFQEYLIDNQKQFLNLKDVNKFKTYISDNVIDDKERIAIHSIFGYADSKDYWKERSNQQERVKYLLKTYNLKNVSKESLRYEVMEAIKSSKGFPFTKSHNIANSNGNTINDDEFLIGGDCEAIRRNCIASVAAEATIMHIGCAVADISVIGGVICHGAAITYQVTAGNNCNRTARNCEAGN